MATISKLWFLRHLRSDPSFHILHYKGAQELHNGRGLSFWFSPLSASISKIPCDDREQAFVIKGRSKDFQEVTCQGVVTYRISEPEKLSRRIDFSIDVETGDFLKTPLNQLSQLLTQLAQQYAAQQLSSKDVRSLLDEGTGPIRQNIIEKLPKDPALWDMGVEVVSILVERVSPSPVLEKALQASTRESIQQEADKATFERRALAVERERAIEENELKNKIELARQEEELIVQRGRNEIKRNEEEVTAKKIAAQAHAERAKLEAATQAHNIGLVEQAKLENEKGRMAIYAELPSQVLFGLAAKELAGNLPKISHLSLSQDSLTQMLQSLSSSQINKSLET
ncbi:MAG: SPFH domain-containing protein [Planctomycetota bacterium]|nr:SPFH domain-containing protein [Planctomycetota bacterium]